MESRILVVDGERCTGCRECVDRCPSESLEMRGSIPALAYPEDCLSCGTCVESCPESALSWNSA